MKEILIEILDILEYINNGYSSEDIMVKIKDLFILIDKYEVENGRQ